MVNYPEKRVFALLGAPRSGKDTVARYLVESRNFVKKAFADKIKEEFGVSNEDFEMAKISGKIDNLRKELWEFSEIKKKDDPEYFIRLVIDEVVNTDNSVVITDVRTEDEFNAIFNYIPNNIIKRAYMLKNSVFSWEAAENKRRIKESKISEEFYLEQCAAGRIRQIQNNIRGLYRYYRYLENLFFKEDIMDLIGPNDNLTDPNKYIKNQRMNIIDRYISQFDIIEKI